MLPPAPRGPRAVEGGIGLEQAAGCVIVGRHRDRDDEAVLERGEHLGVP